MLCVPAIKSDCDAGLLVRHVKQPAALACCQCPTVRAEMASCRLDGQQAASGHNFDLCLHLYNASADDRLLVHLYGVCGRSGRQRGRRLLQSGNARQKRNGKQPRRSEGKCAALSAPCWLHQFHMQLQLHATVELLVAPFV